MKFPYNMSLRLPSDLGVIPSIRKFVSEALQVSGFGAKFAFRTEIIVDAICNNAISYGCEGDSDSEVYVMCEIREDCVEIVVRDRGGSSEHLERLREAVSRGRIPVPQTDDYVSSGMGLEIVKLLSETIELHVDENNLTSVHIVRKREEAE